MKAHERGLAAFSHEWPFMVALTKVFLRLKKRSFAEREF
jgi:hypothetical protein